MSSIRLSGVSFSYRDSVDILSRVSLDVYPGWTGIVGENGSGKSTLLALMAGALAPTAGLVTREPEDAVVVSCAQRLGATTPEMHELAAAWTRDETRLRARLALEPADLDRWSTLSPGERKRWQIGAALAAQPDVLLLDEPTNHLDAPARALLLGALARFGGIGLVVSHDRTFLEELTTHTLRVHRGSVEMFRGTYAHARATWHEREQALRQSHEQARQEERALERRRVAEQQKRAGAERQIIARHRMKGPKDSDARGILAKNKAMYAEARHGRNASILRRAVERATEHTASLEITRERGRSLFVDYEPAPMPFLASVERAEIAAGDPAGDSPGDQAANDQAAPVILRDVRVALGRESRVHIAGPNGAGKTTLMRALLRAAQAPEQRREHILYLPQVMEPELVASHLRAMHEHDRATRGRILQVAAALGLDPERVMATDEPSPGEIRKLALARGLGMGAWALFLDEPTNHLDLPSIERLEAALSDYPGAIVLVSHDQPFARALTSTVWRLESGRVIPELRPDTPSLRAAE
jgi:ATPase subunit of ABC transporter with duplicated ATPase domains